MKKDLPSACFGGEGLTPVAIAQILGRHRSTIVRGVRRNHARRDETYRRQLADWYAPRYGSPLVIASLKKWFNRQLKFRFGRSSATLKL